jgi:hypothetical protein
MLDYMDFLLPMLALLLVGVIGITFWIAWIIFRARHKKQLKANEAEPVTVTTPPFSAAPRDVLLAVDRTPDGTWEIMVNGELYPSLEAVPDDAVRQDVIAGLKEVVAFARSYVQKDQAAKKPSAPAVPPQPVRESPLRAAMTPSPTSSGPITLGSRVPPVEKPASPVAPPVASPATPPSTTDRLRVFLKGEPALKRSDAAPTIMPTLDLAREIGEILAEMQAHIPSLAQRSIKLQNAPSGGVYFAIDGIVYADVNEIPDADIQALIHAATKEWERR